MIESIRISDIATYGSTSEVMSALSKFNFLFGSNGSGKTTITRVIADESQFPTCGITWKGGTKLQAMVYNRDFVEKNFNQSNELKGIFTLGEKNVDTLNKITTAKNELDELIIKIARLNLTLNGENGAGGKKLELEALDEEFKTKCWEQKKKHDPKLSGAFEGLRNSQEKFKDRVMQERASNSAALGNLADLEKKAETIFGQTPTQEKLVSTLKTDTVIAHESNPILTKRVIGKEDVDISAMIQKLGNSDWVREGRSFYDINNKACPFCQNSTSDAFAKSLNDYFDETFETDSKAISTLETNYKTDSERLQQEVEAIINSASKYINIELLKTEKGLIDSKIITNNQQIIKKKKVPSQIVELESLRNVLTSISSLIDTANTDISTHNNIVKNLAQERRDLTEQVWKYLLNVELKTDLPTYETKRNGLTSAISKIENQITASTEDKAAKETEIKELEKKITSIQPTINEINALLKSFGFQGFSLAKADKETCYKLIRLNGDDAKETLSEGEKTFVTFLYFYHLLKGSISESGITNDRVIVFDDPVSSLDSDILFIVGSLIKGLFDGVRSGVGHIKQVFILTHNVYFHKEVSFNPDRKNKAMNEETFWVVRKSGSLSKLEKHDSNPIKTSYELLWAEIRQSNPSSLTIQNILRRILENYFKILGGVNPDIICAMFDGKEKFVCKSLFSWVNDGSHSAHDDLYVSIDSSVVETYLKVFRAIFEKSGHSAHYKMMMGEAYAETEKDENIRDGETINQEITVMDDIPIKEMSND